MDKQRRLQKFSIRKYTVGACSILVGTLIFLSSPTHHAFASENTVDATKLEVTKTEKEVEEAVNTTETTSTNQSATDESTEQPKSEEIGKQQIEPEKVGSIKETSKPEESINELENKNEINDKQEAPVKQDTASQPIAETPTVKEDNTQNNTVKSEEKTVAKENEQVQKEVVQPEIKENTQTEKKTSEPEEKLNKTEITNKTAIPAEQPREERSTRTKRELRSADYSTLRENVNNDTNSDNFVITSKAFGKKANDQEVSDYAHIAHSYVKENGDNVEFHYVIHFNKAESNKARGRFYVYAPSFVKLTPGTIQRVTGSGTFNNWKNKATVTGGSKLNSMVYQAMIPVDRDYYKNLTKITDEDNFYYIHEELNYRRNSYIAKMTATVPKDILRKNNGKFYVAIGVATENIVKANRANHVNFIENRASVSDADKFNPKGKEQTVELNEIPNAEQSINTYGLPNGTKYVYTSPIDTSTIGNKNTTVLVSYPDGTHDVVPVVLVVNDTVAPVAPTIETQSIVKDKAINPITIPNATDNSGEIAPTSVTGLPTGLNYNKQTNQITGTPTVEGTNDVTVTYTDTSGNTVTKVFQLNITDTTAPAKPVIQTDLTGKGGTTEPITVQAEPGSKVELFDKDGNKIGEGISDNQGNAVITPTQPLPEGNITAKATDKAENPNTSEPSDSMKVTDTTPPTKPVIQTDLTNKGGTTEPITVQAEPGSKVELFDKDGNKIGEGIADDQGNAVITPTKPLPEGNVTAKATDKAENPNTSEPSEPMISTDTTPPTKPVIQTDLTSKGGTTDPITVQAEPGSKVELFDKDGNKIGEGTADDQGNAVITPTRPLPEGNVTAKATDKAENPNTSEPSDSMKATDTTAPTKPVIQTDLTGKGGTTDPITVQADPGSKVELFDKDGNKIGEGITDDNGFTTITPTRPLPEGNITAKATDKAENPNTSEASEPIKVTDTTPPAKPVIQTDLTGKGGTTDPITVQSEPGSKVELFDKDGNKIGEGETNGNGVAIITPTQPLPEGNITAKATDKAGNPNTSEPSDSMKATDTTPPAKPVIQTDLTGKGGTTEPITVQAEPGSKVELFDKDGNKLGEGTADDQGNTTITPIKPLPEGNVTAKATDKAENPNTSEASDFIMVTNPKDTDDTVDNQDSDIKGNGKNNKDEEVASTDPTKADTDKDDISNKDESNPNGSTPTNNNGDGQPDATTPDQDSNNNGENENPANNNGFEQPNAGGNEQTNNGDGVNNKDEETGSTDSTKSNSNDNAISNGDEDSDKDDISNKDESNPNDSTPTNNNGDGQPDATTPDQNSNNNGENENPANNNGSNQTNTGGNEQTNNGDGVNNKDEETDPNDSTPTNNDGDGQPDATTPLQDPNNNDSGQSNTGDDNPNNADQSKDTDKNGTPNNQDSDIEGNGVNNKDENVTSTDPMNSDSNDNGISDGDEVSGKDGISNKDESNPNGSTPTNNNGDGQSDITTSSQDPNNNGENENPGNNNGYEQPNTGGNGQANNGDGQPDATTPPQDSNNNDSGQFNTGDDILNNADHPKNTDGDSTPINQDSDIEGNGVNNKDENVASTDPTNSGAKENGSLRGIEKSGINQSSIQPNLDGNGVTNNSSVNDKQSMNKYDKLNSNNDIIKLAAKDDITSEGNGVTNINNELNNDSSMNQQNSNTNLNDQNATNNMSNNDQSSEAHSNTDHEGAKVLPDTGEEESKLAGLLSITSLFGGLALLFRRKKSEDKE